MLLRRYLSNCRQHPRDGRGGYTITSYTRRSNTSMTFYDRGNDRPELEDGSAFLTAEGISTVCAADVVLDLKMDETPPSARRSAPSTTRSSQRRTRRPRRAES